MTRCSLPSWNRRAWPAAVAPWLALLFAEVAAAQPAPPPPPAAEPPAEAAAPTPAAPTPAPLPQAATPAGAVSVEEPPPVDRPAERQRRQRRDPHADLHGEARGPRAQDPADAPPPLGWHAKAWLNQRFVADQHSLVEATGPLPTESLRLQSPLEVEARTRVGGEMAWRDRNPWLPQVKADVELEIRSWDRPEPALRDGPTLLRRASVEATTRFGQFTLGRTQSTWGLGLLAHDGTEDAMQFGARRGSNTVTRLGYAVLPAAVWQGGDPSQAFPLALAVAYDWVGRDDLAAYPGDKATNAIAAILYRGKVLQAGVYGVLRNQEDIHGLKLEAQIADAFFRWRRTFGATGSYLEFAGEGVLITGHTGWLATPSQPGGMDLSQLGGVGRFEMGNPWGSVFRVETGLASADSRPSNDTLRSLRFSTDYRVGLVMFPVAQRLLSQQAAANLADPRYSAQPPAGIERVQSDGAVSQARYVNPVLRMQASPRTSVLLGALWAMAPSDVADPYRSWLSAGKAVGPRGAVAKRDLGLELDAALETKTSLGDHLDLVLRADAGVWFPGEAFDDASGQPMAAVGAWQGTLLLRTAL